MELDRDAGRQGDSVSGSRSGCGPAHNDEHGPGAGTWDWDIPTGDIVWSGLLYTLFGLDPAKDPASFDAWNRILHPDDAAAANDRIRRALADHTLLNSEYRIVRPDGEVRWINAIGEGIYGGDGRPVRMTGICVDVTRRRTAEEALAESERRYRAIADYTQDWEFWFGPKAEILYQSPSAERIVGRPVNGYSSYEAFLHVIVHPDDLSKRLDHLKDELAGRGPSEMEFRIIRPDGEVRWIHHVCRSIYDAGGAFLGTRGSNRDITERKRGEESLRESEQRFRAIAETTPVMLSVSSLQDNTVLFVNPAYERTFGFEPGEFIGKKAVTVYCDDADRDGIIGILQRGGEIRNRQVRVKRKDGTPFWVDSSVTRIRIAGKDALLGASVDITERKRAEEALGKSRARTVSILESIADTFYSLDEEWRFTVVNPAAEKAPFGRPASELIGKVIWNLYPNLVGTEIHRHYLAAAQYHTLEHYEAQSPLNGRWYEVFMQGRSDGVDVYMRDITGRRSTEEALQRAHDGLEVQVQERTAELKTSVAYNRSLIESGLDLMVTIDPGGKISDVNAATVEMTGFPREELIGTDFSDFFTEPDKARAGYQKVFREGFVRDFPLGMRHRDGRITPVLYNATIFFDEKGVTAGAFAVARDISALKKAERDLEKAHAETRVERQRLYEVLETLPVYVCLLDANYRMPFANRYFRTSFGYSLIRTCYEFLFNRTEPCENCESYKVMKTRAPHHWSWTGPNGRNYDIYDFPFTDTDGSPLILEMGIDITEQKKAEEAVRKAAAYNRSLIEASPDPIAIINAGGKISDVNEATVAATGLSREELIGTDFSQYFTDPARAKEGYESVFRDGSVTDFALEIRHRSGRLIPALYNASVLRDDTGTVTGVFAAARDISALKKAEEELSQLAAIVENSDDAIIGKSLEGIVVSWNSGAEKIYGYPASEAIGRCIRFLAPPGEDDDLDYILKKVRNGVPVFHYETRRIRNDGRIIDVALTVSPIRDRKGAVVGASTIARDVTERKRAEAAIERAAAYNRSLIEASVDPLVTIDPGGRISDVNAATVAATGLTREELIGTDFSDYFTEPDRAKAGYESAFRNGSVTDYGLGIRHRDGRVTPVLYNATVYRDASGKVTGVFAAARDITEQKRAEEALKKANEALEKRVAERTAELAGSNEELRAANEELAAAHEELNLNIGELTRNEELLRQKAAELTEALAEKEMLLSEIHHRVKNNLTAFISLLSLEGSYEESEAGKQLKKDLQNRARSMALIHETLYRTKKYSHVDMGVYLTTLVGQITTSYSTRRDVHVTVSADGVVLDLSRATPCGLIINELVTNSFKYAFPPGFDCASVRNGPCTIGVSLESEDTMYRLTVSDNGAGLPAGINISTAKSLGLKLVNFLAKHQLQAAILVDTTAGTSIEFQFKKDPGLP